MSKQLKCIHCGHEDTGVTRTDRFERYKMLAKAMDLNALLRIRKCKECGKRMQTIELPIEQLPAVQRWGEYKHGPKGAPKRMSERTLKLKAKPVKEIAKEKSYTVHYGLATMDFNKHYKRKGDRDALCGVRTLTTPAKGQEVASCGACLALLALAES